VTVSPELRPTDLRLAHAHLRLGQYGFARAELETLAVRAELDRDGLADLAEARWRTGDLPRAGEAAQAYLDAGGDRTAVLVIAAEAAMADGRPADARRLADTVLVRPDDLDGIFAGQPRSRVWRAAGAYVEPEAGATEGRSQGVGEEVTAETQVIDLAELTRARGAAQLDAVGLDAAAGQAVADGASAGAAAAGRGAADVAPPGEPATSRAETGQTVAGREAGGTARGLGAETASASAHRLISFAASALRDDRARAAVELSLVLRSEPSLAPAVLELIARTSDAPASRSGAALEIVRGDAYRLIGRPREAEHAYARAMSILGGLLDGPTR